MAESNSKTKAEINQKIQFVLMKMGLSFIDCAGFVEYDKDAETAYWSYNKGTGEESIHIGPEIAVLDNDSLEMVLRHEILHRSTYHGFYEYYEDPQLSNITLDICINRLLFEAYPDKMKKLSKIIYPEESKSTIIALADCSAGTTKLTDGLGKLWTYIWKKNISGSFNSLNPTSLYYRLTTLRSKIPALFDFKNPYLIDYRDGNLPPTLSDGIGKKIGDIIKNTNKSLPAGSSLGEELSTYSISSIDFGTSDIAKFLRNINVRRIADNLVSKISDPWQKENRVQAYPVYPTRKGFIFLALGLSDVFSFYYNQDVSDSGARMTIGLYMDVSGSMANYFNIVAHIIKTFKEFPLRMKAFDTSVYEVNIDEVLAGKILGGGYTDFDKPILDFIDDSELEAGVLFTDGGAEVSMSVGEKLKKSSKRLYVVYFISGDRKQFSSDLDKYSFDKTYINVSE